MKRARTVRTRRALPPIGERDLDILTLVGLCRFVTTAQIARDLFHPKTGRGGVCGSSSTRSSWPSR